MTDEERQRAMDFIAEQTAKSSLRTQQPDEKETEERRKLNRDMDRLERVLKTSRGTGSASAQAEARGG